MTHIRHALAIVGIRAATALVAPASIVGAQAGAALTGIVRDAASGKALTGARILVDRRNTSPDSVGRWSLNGLTPGAVHVRVVAIGFRTIDTSVVLSERGARLDLALQPLFADRAMRAADAADVAAGRTDSSASGLFQAPAEPPLTFFRFGARLLQEVAREQPSDSNTVLSPPSAAFALSMPLLGAAGATATEITTALGVPAMDRPTLQRRTATAMIAGTGRTDVDLETANAMWVDKSVGLNDAFVREIAQYRASLRSEWLPSRSALDKINAWADSATHGKIREVLTEPLPDSAKLFLANAVYFKGKWLDRFDKEATRRRPFRLSSGKVIEVDGMEQRNRVGFARGERYQMVRLPYRGGRFAMYVVLPDSGTSPDAIAAGFVAHGMPPSLVEKDFTDVRMIIPRAHVTAQYDLIPALEALGVKAAFDCKRADFKRLVDEVTWNNLQGQRLCIGAVSQSVYLHMDEEGTEAAAVTGILMVTVVSAPPPPIEFIVDRPYLLLLRDEQTKTDTFVGIVRRP